MSFKWRYSQKACNQAIFDVDKSSPSHWRGLIKMFCGTGKSLIAMHWSMVLNKKLSVFVFPTISLITQFHIDYILDEKWKTHMQTKKRLSICSKNELKKCDEKSKHKIHYTTNATNISTFLGKSGKKVVTVTYASFPLFFKIICQNTITIDIMIFDEAHHIIGNTIYKHIVSKKYSDLVLKSLFFTATPVNRGDIKMLDRENPESSFCGPLIFEWTHRQAVEEGICNSFDISIQLYCPKSPGAKRYLNYMEKLRLLYSTNMSGEADETTELSASQELDDEDYKAFKNEHTEFLYDSLARTGLSTGNKRALTFHAQSETLHKTKTHVKGFVQPAQFKKRLRKIHQKEFPDIEFPTRSTFKGITTKTRNRRADELNDNIS